MKYFLLLNLLLFPLISNARVFQECGVYKIEGFLKLIEVKGEKKMVMLVEKNSDSEITLNLGKYDSKKYLHYIGTNVAMDISITEECGFSCNATIVNFNKMLDPFDKPKPFLFPKPIPQQKLKCVVKSSE